jgi:gluconolactonase
VISCRPMRARRSCWFLLLSPALACATGGATGTPTANGAGGPALFPGAGVPTAIPSAVPFVSLEGPLWLAAGHKLLFSDVVEANAEGAHIYVFDPSVPNAPSAAGAPGAQAFSTVRYPAAAPTSTNGLAIDPTGRLVACERYNGRVVRLQPGAAGSPGKLTVLADRWPALTGVPLNAPNDLVMRADGNLYFTDSDWGVRTGSAHAPMGVYRVSPAGELSRVLDLEKPNGIALSPDGATLYVGSDTQAKIWKLPVDAAGAVGAPTLFIDGPQVSGGFKVPDGICVDDRGDLYVANNDDAVKAIVVFDPAGHSLGRIPFPLRPSNCSFGGAERRTLYVTTLHAVYALPVPTPGLP